MLLCENIIMSDNESNNKRIAKNTIMLYIRMFIATVVGLYTTRVVLQTLGVEDYGIYGVVGSIIAMLGFLKSSMSSSTSRFLSYDLGKGDMYKLRDTFSAAMIIHILFAAVIAVFGETIGMWFLENKLVIPVGRMDAAKWVLHLSVIASAVTITQVPYNSCIISHERMGIYAYMEIVNVFLKLFIVYLLTIGNCDRLKLYVSLTLAVTILMSSLYRIYCVRHFIETRIVWKWNREDMKRIMGFSVWQMFSSICMSLKQQGQNFIVNIYRGVTLNASLGISDMLYGTLTSLSYNMLSAFNPPIVKAYANGDYVQMSKLIMNASKMSFMLLAFVSVPFIINMHFILELWLGKVPEYVCEICSIALVFNCLGVVNAVYSDSINATGKNRNKTIIVGLSGLIGLITLCVTFYLELPIIYSFCAFYLGTPIMLVGCMIEAKRRLPFLPLFALFVDGLLKPSFVAISVFSVVFLLKSFFQTGFVQLSVTSFVSSLLFLYLIYQFILDSSQKKMLNYKIVCLLAKRNRINK